LGVAAPAAQGRSRRVSERPEVVRNDDGSSRRPARIRGEIELNDTWSYTEDRELLIRDLTNAPSKRNVLIKDATHFVLFEKPRFEFFNEIHTFLKE
jgi:hypothetical protein